jgi:beta-phosphoglucomutase-like phosphatase (HAD superfamily)
MRLKAVIFDMDGLLLETEKIALKAFQEAAAESGLKLDLATYYRCIGTTHARTREILMEGYGPDFPYEKMAVVWNKKFTYQVENFPIPLKEGTIELLQYLVHSAIPRAVVTSTRSGTALKMLDNAGIINYFEFVIGGDQIVLGKPNPEIYLKACERFKVEPGDCLALEDSENGVRSALAAGLTVIQIPDLIQPSSEVKTFGHQIMKSLLEVKQYLLSIDNR